MATNKRPQNKHTPYRLIIDGKIYGHYANLSTASDIGRNTKKYYRVYRSDELVEEG